MPAPRRRGDDQKREVQRDQQHPPVQPLGSAQPHPEAQDRHQPRARHRDRPRHDGNRGQRRQQPDGEKSDWSAADHQVRQGGGTSQQRRRRRRGLAADHSEHRERHTQDHDQRDRHNSPTDQHPRQPWTSTLNRFCRSGHGPSQRTNQTVRPAPSNCHAGVNARTAVARTNLATASAWGPAGPACPKQNTVTRLSAKAHPTSDGTGGSSCYAELADSRNADVRRLRLGSPDAWGRS